jgi:hypothetical protein
MGRVNAMGRALLIAGLAIFAVSTPAVAKPDHSGHGKPQRGVDKQGVGYGVGGCPPGLKKKNAECMPPGRHKQLFNVGERVPSGHKGLMGYNALPYEVRRQYGGALDPRGRYIYDDQYLYRVDPTTMVVRQILRGVIGY